MHPAKTSGGPDRYAIVRLGNGAGCVRSLAEQETFHPGIGPAAEAEALYVRQLRLAERVRVAEGEFVLWDVGLGAAANALTALRLIRAVAAGKPRQLRMISFDRTTTAASFALEHAAELGYLDGYETALETLIERGAVGFDDGGIHVEWSFERGDFPALMARGVKLPAPDAILFDPHSPRKNPEMWTVPLFTDLFRALDPKRPCALATFTRSTMARTAMLSGGFFVGVGHPSGLKEETTVAANRIELLDEPLDGRWRERAGRSKSAEPLTGSVYRQAMLSAETSARLRRHPQFQNANEHERH